MEHRCCDEGIFAQGSLNAMKLSLADFVLSGRALNPPHGDADWCHSRDSKAAHE